VVCDHVIKLSTKLEQNRTIRGWVTFKIWETPPCCHDRFVSIPLEPTSRTRNAPLFQIIWVSYWWSNQFSVVFSGCKFDRSSSQRWADWITPNMGRIQDCHRNLKIWLTFLYVSAFRNHSALQWWTGGQTRHQLLHFLRPCKIRGGVGDSSSSIFISAYVWVQVSSFLYVPTSDVGEL